MSWLRSALTPRAVPGWSLELMLWLPNEVAGKAPPAFGFIIGRFDYARQFGLLVRFWRWRYHACFWSSETIRAVHG